MARPHKRSPAAGNGQASGSAVCAATPNTFPLAQPSRKAQALTVLGSIKKSNAAQLRIAVSEWKGDRKVEIRECTRLFDQTFFPVGKPLTLDLDKVPELIALLEKAVRP